MPSSIDLKTLVSAAKEFLHLQLQFLLENLNQNGNMKKNVYFSAFFLCNLALITHNAPLSVISSICHATHPAISLENDLTSYMKHCVV